MFKRRRGSEVEASQRRGHRSGVYVQATIGASPQSIWDVLARPGSVADEQSDVISAFVAPGTGPGRGEVQIVVSGVAGTANVSLSSVVVEESRPPHFVRFLGLTDVSTSLSRSEISLTQRDAGTLVDYQIEIRASAGTPLRSAMVPTERFLHHHIVRELSAVADVLGARMHVVHSAAHP